MEEILKFEMIQIEQKMNMAEGIEREELKLAYLKAQNELSEVQLRKLINDKKEAEYIETIEKLIERIRNLEKELGI
jgi:hypothetical protein